jgi:DNA-binding response OmpR family regulator
MKTILVIEDDKLLNSIYKLKLEKVGYNVVILETGDRVIETVKETSPNLIILDLVMPSVDGFEVLKTLQEHNLLEKIPVIVLTNLSQIEDIQKAKAMGAGDYLVKANTSFKEVLENITHKIPK